MEALWAVAFLAFFGLPLAALVIGITALSRARSLERTLDERIREIDLAIQSLRRRLKAAETEPAPEPPPSPQPEPAPRPVPAPAPPPPPAPKPVAAPPKLEPIPEAARGGLSLEQIVGGRWATWAGAVLLLFAIGFLLRWTFQNNLIGPAGRVALGLASGVGLGVAGTWLRRRPNLAVLCDGLTGAGLGMLYLSLFAAHRVYGFLDATPAFAAMAGVTALGVAVSVGTSRQAIAILALIGGLLTPVLVSAKRPDEQVLFAYLIVLDLLILGVARFRMWPVLNRIAWTGTWLLAAPVLAGPASAAPAARLCLLAAIFLIFLAAPLVRSWLDRVEVHPLDLFLVAGNAAAFFWAVYVTVERWRPRDEAMWAVALAALYFGVAQYHRERVEGGDVHAVTLHRGLGMLFLAAAPPLWLDGPWVTLSWAILGAIFVTLGVERGFRYLDVAGGALLLAGAAGRAAWLDTYWAPPETPVWNAGFAVHLAVVACLLWAGWRAGRGEEGGDDRASARTVLWFGSAALLAILFWQEPVGLWRAGLLAAECLALAAASRAIPDAAWPVGAATVAGIFLARSFLADFDAAAGAAAELANATVAVRILGVLGIGAAGAVVLRGEPREPSRVMGIAMTSAAGVALLAALSLAWGQHQSFLAGEAMRHGNGMEAKRLRWLLQVGLSVLWTLYAAGTLAFGFSRAVAAARYAALGLFGITIAKVFLVDLAGLDAIYRILSFFVLGVVLLAVAYAYQRGRPHIDRTG